MKRRIVLFTSIVTVLAIGIGFIFILNQPVTPDLPSVIEPEPEPKPQEKTTHVDVLTFGDILYHSSFLKDTSVEAFAQNFEYMKPHFDAADLVISNYETTTNPALPYSGYPQFNTPENAIQAIAEAGIDVLNTNNNHSMDTRLSGVRSTLETIRKYGITTVGTNLEDEAKRTDLLINEIKIGLLSYSFSYNGFEAILHEKELTETLSIINEDNMKREIDASKAVNDATFVIMHWGIEYDTSPSQAQIDLAQKMADWGVDVIIGMHPHVVQKTDTINNTFVIYSMGNFVSDQRLETLQDINTEQGLMVGFTVTKDHLRNTVTITNKKHIPTWVYKYRKNGASYYKVVPTPDYINGTLTNDGLDAFKSRIQKAHDTILERVEPINQ